MADASSREDTWGRKGGGFRTTLVMALCIVILSVALRIGISRFNFMVSLPLVGPLFDERPERTTTGPVVVEGIQRPGAWYLALRL